MTTLPTITRRAYVCRDCGRRFNISHRLDEYPSCAACGGTLKPLPAGEDAFPVPDRSWVLDTRAGA